MRKEGAAMIELRDNYWAVEVPQGAINIIIDMGYIIWKEPNYKNWCTDAILSDYGKLSKYLETHKAEDDYKTGGMPLPPGTWQIVCPSKWVSEEQARQIIEQQVGGGMFKDYQLTGSHAKYGTYILPYASKSLASLLTSKGCDTKLNWLILKKQ
jgi:hypothetical protein